MAQLNNIGAFGLALLVAILLKGSVVQGSEATDKAMLKVLIGLQNIIDKQTKALDKLTNSLQQCSFCSGGHGKSGNLWRVVEIVAKDGPADNPTDPCSRNPCYQGVACSNRGDVEEGFLCDECPIGLTGDGKTCHDVDECAEHNPCSDKSHCINLKDGAGFRCEQCPPGYSGNEVSGKGIAEAKNQKQVCTDVDECLLQNTVCPQEPIPGSKCINTPGHFYCSCPKGHLGPEYGNCTFAGYCNYQTCHANATCKANGLTEHCSCDVGFAGNGVLCGPDSDHDGTPDDALPCDDPTCRADNCRHLPNSEQKDLDGDGIGDECDDDSDGDRILNFRDNCPLHPNPRQHDRDMDKVGNRCDNCIDIPNEDQIDTDFDGLGDECDDDIDNDGILNTQDNCVYRSNRDQADVDLDGVGDVCDNCPKDANPDQKDGDKDIIGDVCDDFHDKDQDGIPDHMDNCPDNPNSLQTDKDNDHIGDICDNDIDADGRLNQDDNCPYVFNPLQIDNNHDGKGDACDFDFDGDNITDDEDDCPLSAKVGKLYLSDLLVIPLDPLESSQYDPKWVILNRGYEAKQTVNSDPGIMVASYKLGDINFDGTFYVNSEYDDDYFGFVFGYQDEGRFYVIMWKERSQTYWKPTPSYARGQAGIAIKVVNSTTGPGPALRNALWHTGNTKDQVTTIWHDRNKIGWKAHVSYRWTLQHRPNSGLIRLVVYEGAKEIVNSGCLYDKTNAGGRIGLFVFSQEQVIWSNVKVKCESSIPYSCMLPASK